MIPLVVLKPRDGQVPVEFTNFADDDHPLRPSKTSQFLGCPMSTFLRTMIMDEQGGEAAQSGNLVHSAAAVYHRTVGEETTRTEAGLAALEAARSEFPLGNPEKARSIFKNYTADARNQTANCIAVEKQVTLRLAPAPNDPTGKPVVIVGTLDQVRLEADGKKRVYDIKTGSGLDPTASKAEYQVQQALYVLAARQNLDPDIEPGYLIYTPAYDKARGRPFLYMEQTIDSCMALAASVVTLVANVRAGNVIFHPTPDNCRFCPLSNFSNCFSFSRGML